jgi:hypothetical protein
MDAMLAPSTMAMASGDPNSASHLATPGILRTA